MHRLVLDEIRQKKDDMSQDLPQLLHYTKAIHTQYFEYIEKKYSDLSENLGTSPSSSALAFLAKLIEQAVKQPKNYLRN